MPTPISPDEAKYHCKRYLRRKFAGDLSGLQLLADQCFAEGSETVTLTQGSFEGGQGSGQVTFDKILLLGCVEDLIEEIDPNWKPAPTRSSGVVLQMGGYPIGNC